MSIRTRSVTLCAEHWTPLHTGTSALVQFGAAGTMLLRVCPAGDPAPAGSGRSGSLVIVGHEGNGMAPIIQIALHPGDTAYGRLVSGEGSVTICG